MDQLHTMPIFVRVEGRGSFAAAARDRELEISPPPVTRAASALEEHLGTRLFVPTTRSLRLTESGKRFLKASVTTMVKLAMGSRSTFSSQRSDTSRHAIRFECLS